MHKVASTEASSKRFNAQSVTDALIIDKLEKDDGLLRIRFHEDEKNKAEDPNYPHCHNLEHHSITRVERKQRSMLKAKTTGTAGTSCKQFNIFTEMHFITIV